ncbi:inhibitor of nuclear factor kappa-B kinase-interacting protein isoform X1 [Tachyglossus aculeatus]|uniref:inhibitor of nuclear factor kappa-B kinase-interacting protein isoform X1 n=1 Tax=Tachyglossus aculeatus TaxID=9261 RepID=UPI0018F54F78|nr:inhibitor of nuclear factor kappa-B kinase-interacting protein isoform X1 [Tachyglossus aculeatus]
MSEAKPRKKGGPKRAPEAGPRPSESRRAPGAPGAQRGGTDPRADPRAALGLLSCGACLALALALAWFIFQQSEKFTSMDNKYQFMERSAKEFQDLKNKVSLLSDKLESTESILQEATSSMALVTKFEQEVSSLHSAIYDIQNSEQLLTQKIQSINVKFENVSDSWKRSLDEMNANAVILKSEAKRVHSQVTAQINSAEQGVKSLTERLKDLEDSTVRNIRTLKSQEDDDLSRVEKQLGSDTKAVEKLEEEQSNLFARDLDLSSKLTAYEPKVEECKTHMPVIENAIHSVLKVSQELTGVEKRMDDLAEQMFNVEDDMLKAVSEIMEMQKALEGMQFDNSILKMQNELVVLKEKVQEFIVSMNAREEGTFKEHNLPSKEFSSAGEQ